MTVRLTRDPMWSCIDLLAADAARGAIAVLSVTMFKGPNAPAIPGINSAPYFVSPERALVGSAESAKASGV